MSKSSAKNKLSKDVSQQLLKTLEQRFMKNLKRHAGIDWPEVKARIEKSPDKLWSLNEMEITGGEPDVIGRDKTGSFIFCDCAAETPAGRRSLCYDGDALDARKDHKPENAVIDMAAEMGISVLNESEYRELQKLGPFDQKTSSWILTPEDIRKAGGALFGDFRYGHVFIYHNGAQSYYAARGFRGILNV